MVKFLRYFRRKPVRTGPRVYKPLAVTAEAHDRIVAKADKKGMTIIDYVDHLVGV
jgi:hypothetical protein